MSGMIDKAVNTGLAQGFALHAATLCDGHDDPEERCPMRPSEGCACIYARWRALPWWRRWMVEEPPVPLSYSSISLCIEAAVERETDIAARRARAAGIPVKEVG